MIDDVPSNASLSILIVLPDTALAFLVKNSLKKTSRLATRSVAVPDVKTAGLANTGIVTTVA